MLQEISILCGKKKNGEKSLVPLDALQHLNKDKGEALVLSGRLYPIITKLADIKKYDGDHPLPSIAMKPIDQVNNQVDYSKKIQMNQSAFVKQDEIDSDIQEELERKFDELFGSMQKKG